MNIIFNLKLNIFIIPEIKYDPVLSGKWVGFNVDIRWLFVFVIGIIDRSFNVSRELRWTVVITN